MDIQDISALVNAFMPLFVAGLGLLGSVTVAKINKMQADIKTNRGSRNIGDAMDRLHDEVQEVKLMANASQQRDLAIESRLLVVERATGVSKCYEPTHGKEK